MQPNNNSFHLIAEHLTAHNSAIILLRLYAFKQLGDVRTIHYCVTATLIAQSGCNDNLQTALHQL